MRIFCLFLLLLAGTASAHGCWDRCDRHGWRDDGCWRESRRSWGWRDSHRCSDSCGWHAHRRWYRHTHYTCSAWSCGAPHHHHIHEVSCGQCSISAKDFPANPVDGQKVRVHGVKYEWDADDHRWERD